MNAIRCSMIGTSSSSLLLLSSSSSGRITMKKNMNISPHCGNIFSTTMRWNKKEKEKGVIQRWKSSIAIAATAPRTPTTTANEDSLSAESSTTTTANSEMISILHTNNINNSSSSSSSSNIRLDSEWKESMFELHQSISRHAQYFVHSMDNQEEEEEDDDDDIIQKVILFNHVHHNDHIQHQQQQVEIDIQQQQQQEVEVVDIEKKSMEADSNHKEIQEEGTKGIISTTSTMEENNNNNNKNISPKYLQNKQKQALSKSSSSITKHSSNKKFPFSYAIRQALLLNHKPDLSYANKLLTMVSNQKIVLPNSYIYYGTYIQCLPKDDFLSIYWTFMQYHSSQHHHQQQQQQHKQQNWNPPFFPYKKYFMDPSAYIKLCTSIGFVLQKQDSSYKKDDVLYSAIRDIVYFLDLSIKRQQHQQQFQQQQQHHHQQQQFQQQQQQHHHQQQQFQQQQQQQEYYPWTICQSILIRSLLQSNNNDPWCWQRAVDVMNTMNTIDVDIALDILSLISVSNLKLIPFDRFFTSLVQSNKELDTSILISILNAIDPYQHPPKRIENLLTSYLELLQNQSQNQQQEKKKKIMTKMNKLFSHNNNNNKNNKEEDDDTIIYSNLQRIAKDASQIGNPNLVSLCWKLNNSYNNTTKTSSSIFLNQEFFYECYILAHVLSKEKIDHIAFQIMADMEQRYGYIPSRSLLYRFGQEIRTSIPRLDNAYYILSNNANKTQNSMTINIMTTSSLNSILAGCIPDGLVDKAFLTYEEFSSRVIPCDENTFLFLLHCLVEHYHLHHHHDHNNNNNDKKKSENVLGEAIQVEFLLEAADQILDTITSINDNHNFINNNNNHNNNQHPNQKQQMPITNMEYIIHQYIHLQCITGNIDIAETILEAAIDSSQFILPETLELVERHTTTSTRSRSSMDNNNDDK